MHLKWLISANAVKWVADDMGANFFSTIKNVLATQKNARARLFQRSRQRHFSCSSFPDEQFTEISFNAYKQRVFFRVNLGCS